MSDSVWPYRRQPTRLPRPWDSPVKNTGVSCHFLLQCMKVESESEVAQSCPTLSDPMDCTLPGSSIHGVFQPRVLEWGAIAFSEHTHTTIYQIIKKDLLQSTETSTQYSIIIYMGKDSKKERRKDICITEVLYYTPETQHCKSIILQYKIKIKKTKVNLTLKYLHFFLTDIPNLRDRC